MQQHTKLGVGGFTRLNDARQTIGTAPAHAMRHPAVPVGDQVGGRAEVKIRRYVPAGTGW